MRPVYPYIAVEPTEAQDSMLVHAIDERPVVRIIAMPLMPQEELSTVHLSTGNMILVNHVDEYLVDGTKYFYVKMKDVVSVI